MKLIQAMTSGLQAKRHIPCTSETPASVSGRSLALPLPPWQPLLPIAGMPAHHAGSPMWRSCLQSQGCLPLPLQQLLWLQLRGGGGGGDTWQPIREPAQNVRSTHLWNSKSAYFENSSCSNGPWPIGAVHVEHAPDAQAFALWM